MKRELNHEGPLVTVGTLTLTLTLHAKGSLYRIWGRGVTSYDLFFKRITFAAVLKIECLGR